MAACDDRHGRKSAVESEISWSSSLARRVAQAQRLVLAFALVSVFLRAILANRPMRRGQRR